jgi:glycine cleavage system regulatory protein
MQDVVLTLIGPDRPGIVEALAKRVAAQDGNWLESRMARLGGQFAGILHLEVPPERLQALQGAIAELEKDGLRVVAQSGARPIPEGARVLELEAVGQDHPGIVRDISAALLRHGVNIAELSSDRVSAPMAGGLLFRAKARLHVPAGTDTELLREELEQIADDLMVDLTLLQSVTAGPRSRKRG